MVSSRWAQRVVDAPIRRFEGETLTVPASNGTRSSYNVRPDYSEILIEPIAAMRLQLVPAIKGLLFYDASQGRFYDILDPGYRPNFLDRTLTETTTLLGSMTSADYLYVGTVGPVGGFTVDMGGTVNAVAATLSAQYVGIGKTWQTLTIAADGTSSAGATLAQDGLVTITVPAGWTSATLEQVVTGAPVTRQLYWARYAVSDTLTAAIIVNNLSVVGEIAPGTDSTTAKTGGVWLKAAVEYTMDVDADVGALEIMAQAAGATTARVTWVAR